MSDIVRLQSNPRMSMGVVYNGVVSLAGQVAIDNGGGSVTDQTREILERIDALLAEAGTDKSKLLTANLYILDVSTMPEVNALWDKWLAPGRAPTRTTIETKLASPRYALEIGITAAVG